MKCGRESGLRVRADCRAKELGTNLSVEKGHRVSGSIGQADRKNGRDRK